MNLESSGFSENTPNEGVEKPSLHLPSVGTFCHGDDLCGIELITPENAHHGALLSHEYRLAIHCPRLV